MSKSLHKNVDDLMAEFLYSPDVLFELDFKKESLHFAPEFSFLNPAENLVLRPLSLRDFCKGYLDLLRQLTVIGDVSEKTFEDSFREIQLMKGHHYITVIEDQSTKQVIASSTLFVERKFIHDAGLRGRIEDVVVDSNYRGKQLGKLMVIISRLLAEHIGCYKLSLDCKDKMVKYYTQLGFTAEEGNCTTLVIRY